MADKIIIEAKEKADGFNGLMIGIFFLFVSLCVFCGNVYAQENNEVLRISITEVSHPVFNPEKDKDVVFSGEIFYVTKNGTFDVPELYAQIKGLDFYLTVDLRQEALTAVPEELKDLARLWNFTVKWNGLDKDSFPVEPGNYQFLIATKVIKTITEIKKDPAGNDVEIKKQTASEANASASILIKPEE